MEQQNQPRSNEKPDARPAGVSRRNFLQGIGTLVAASGLAALPTFGLGAELQEQNKKTPNSDIARVAADPIAIPAPIHRNHAITHNVTLETKEVVGEIEPGVTFRYMTFNGQVPGPMIRVRQGDTVNLTFKNGTGNMMPHNVDLHAVYGTGGGANATLAMPGETKRIRFKTLYPGAFIYHCAVPNMDYHISSGMFGMIVVEPKKGLPPVDREFYLGQNEVYTDKPTGKKGHHQFDFDKMAAENPTYVLLNGEKYALTPDHRGAMKAKTGETARIFLVTGGPNLTSSFHAIGNVFVKAWREGAFGSKPSKYLQTCSVAPGSTGVFHLEFPLAQKVKLVDHALSRVIRKGLLAIIDVEGEDRPDIFNPSLS